MTVEGMTDSWFSDADNTKLTVRRCLKIISRICALLWSCMSARWAPLISTSEWQVHFNSLITNLPSLFHWSGSPYTYELCELWNHSRGQFNDACGCMMWLKYMMWDGCLLILYHVLWCLLLGDLINVFYVFMFWLFRACHTWQIPVWTDSKVLS